MRIRADPGSPSRALDAQPGQVLRRATRETPSPGSVHPTEPETRSPRDPSRPPRPPRCPARRHLAGRLGTTRRPWRSRTTSNAFAKSHRWNFRASASASGSALTLSASCSHSRRGKIARQPSIHGLTNAPSSSWARNRAGTAIRPLSSTECRYSPVNTRRVPCLPHPGLRPLTGGRETSPLGTTSCHFAAFYTPRPPRQRTNDGMAPTRTRGRRGAPTGGAGRRGRSIGGRVGGGTERRRGRALDRRASPGATGAASVSGTRPAERAGRPDAAGAGAIVGSGRFGPPEPGRGGAGGRRTGRAARTD